MTMIPVASSSVRISCNTCTRTSLTLNLHLQLRRQGQGVIIPRQQRTVSSLPRGGGGQRTSTLLSSTASRRIPVRVGPRSHSLSRGTAIPTPTTVATGQPTTANTISTSRGLSSLKKTARSSTGKRRKATLAPNNSSNVGSSATSTTTTGARKTLLDRLSNHLGKPRTIPIPRWVTPKHYSYTYSELFGHASFILVAASYSVDDFLGLRIIAVAGSTSMLFFTYFHPHGRVLWLPFQWNCLFIAINSYRIGRVYWERYLAQQLSDELKDAREKHFYLMDPTDFGRLARLGTVETYRKGDVVVQQDEPNSHVRVVLSGGCKVMRNGGLTYTLSEGNFISESGLHAGLMLPDYVDSCCTIEAESDVRLLSWDRTELVDLLNRSPHLRRSLKAVLSWDIVRKLKAQRIMLASGAIRDPEGWTHRRHEQGEHRYAAILKNLLSSQPTTIAERKKELNKYRTVHHIDDEHHQEALKECGWTVEEFEAGRKENATLADVNKQKHGPPDVIRQMIMRMVG